jgi:hypothetical protein
VGVLALFVLSLSWLQGFARNQQPRAGQNHLAVRRADKVLTSPLTIAYTSRLRTRAPGDFRTTDPISGSHLVTAADDRASVGQVRRQAPFPIPRRGSSK